MNEGDNQVFRNLQVSEPMVERNSGKLYFYASWHRQVNKAFWIAMLYVRVWGKQEDDQRMEFERERYSNVEFGRKGKKISMFISGNADVARYTQEWNALVFDLEIEYQRFDEMNNWRYRKVKQI